MLPKPRCTRSSNWYTRSFNSLNGLILLTQKEKWYSQMIWYPFDNLHPSVFLVFKAVSRSEDMPVGNECAAAKRWPAVLMADDGMVTSGKRRHPRQRIFLCESSTGHFGHVLLSYSTSRRCFENGFWKLYRRILLCASDDSSTDSNPPVIWL